MLHFFLKITFRLELWDIEKNASIVTTSSFPDNNYAHGGMLFLSANECRQSGELPQFKRNRPLNFKSSKSN